ncbi:hypothetical protein VPH184E373B_0264 [Vibrio phage 184E37-3b]|nr:hypothetical protein MYOV056v2_p0236 [Vibrio phage 184E37.3a]QZI87161.1 hypothetical protein MYOV085v1_p0142 [Vibrio phage 355E48.1]QZI90068.1 hypothetical protein MYOV057v1_p0153 [Vibrio phage 184E37.1]
MRAERWLGQKTGALPSIKKKTVSQLGVYAGKSEQTVYGKSYIVYHHFFVDSEGNVVKYENIYEEIKNENINQTT